MKKGKEVVEKKGKEKEAWGNKTRGKGGSGEGRGKRKKWEGVSGERRGGGEARWKL